MIILRFILLKVFFLNLFSCYAQSGFPKDIFITTQNPNSFIYGDDSVVHYIKKNFKVCKNSIEKETIVLKFIVEPDGSQSNLNFITDNNELIKRDILKMFDEFPKWRPGIQFEKPVSSLRLLLFKCVNGEVLLPPYETPKFRN